MLHTHTPHLFAGTLSEHFTEVGISITDTKFYIRNPITLSFKMHYLVINLEWSYVVFSLLYFESICLPLVSHFSKSPPNLVVNEVFPTKMNLFYNCVCFCMFFTPQFTFQINRFATQIGLMDIKWWWLSTDFGVYVKEVFCTQGGLLDAKATLAVTQNTMGIQSHRY